MAFLNIEIRPYFFLFTGSHLARKERYTIAYDQHVHYRSGSARTSISRRSQTLFFAAQERRTRVTSGW